MRPADRAWFALAAGVALWDIACPRGETLSEGVSRYNRARPLITHTVIIYLVGHLLDWWPERYDLLHAASTLKL